MSTDQPQDLLKNIIITLKKCYDDTPNSDMLNKYIYAEALSTIYRAVGSTTKFTKESARYKALIEQNYKPKGEDTDSCMIEETRYEEGTENACIKWNTVVGNTKAKEDLLSGFVKPLLYPGLYGSTTKGILLYGAPGTSKTMLSKAAINELRSTSGIAIHVFSPTAAELKGKYFGESEKNIKALFSCASRTACSSFSQSGKKAISVIILDEIETIAGDRRDDSTGFMTTTVNALLQEMDGINSAPNVSVIAITNYPWRLDSAILRRLPVQSFVTMPNTNEAFQIITKEVRKHILSILTLGRDPIKAYCLKDKTAVSHKSCDDMWDEKYNKYLHSFKDADVIKIAADLAKRQFSGSDIVACVKSLIKKMGEEAMIAGTFVKTGTGYYVSTIGAVKDNVSSSSPQQTTKPTELWIIEEPKIASITYDNKEYHNAKYSTSFQILDPRIKNVYITVNDLKTKKDVDVLLEIVHIFNVKDTGRSFEKTVYWAFTIPSSMGFISRQITKIGKLLGRSLGITEKSYSLDDFVKDYTIDIIEPSLTTTYCTVYKNFTINLPETFIFEITEKNSTEPIRSLTGGTGIYSYYTAAPELVDALEQSFEINKSDGKYENLIPRGDHDKIFHLHFSYTRLLDVVAVAQPNNRKEDIAELVRYSVDPSGFKPKAKSAS